MRQVSDTLAAAITAPERTVRVRLSVDWDGDGHGPAGSLDDISTKASTLTVTSVLQGTQPEQANVVEGYSAATLTAALTAGDTADEQAVRYFSPMATDSPLAGKVRLGRDVACDVEFLTAAGWESMSLLRGVSRGLPVQVASRQANLQVIDVSARLRTPVALPAAVAELPDSPVFFPVKPGMEATWVASYVLSACGVPLAPPPRSGCRIYVPFHGSATPFIQRPFAGAPSSARWISGNASTPIEFVPGPFALATAPVPTSYENDVHVISAPGSPFVTSNGRSSGRIELWVRPTGSEWFDPFTVLMFSNPAGANSTSVDFRLTAAGSLLLQVNNTAVNRVIPGPPCPSDNQWHMVGVHWDDNTGSATFIVDGVTTTTAFTPTPVSSGVIDTDWQGNMTALASVAEWQITTGILPTTAWQPLTYASGAVIDRLQNSLVGIPATDAQEGWSILQGLAAAEQGACYVDPDGLVRLRSRAALISADAQTPVRDVTASRDLFDLAYDYRLDNVFNIVSGEYESTTTARGAQVWALGTAVFVSAGGSVDVEAPLVSALATRQWAITGHANTVADGSGTAYAVAADYQSGVQPGPVTLSVTFSSQSAAVITVYNGSTSSLWMVDSSGSPDLTMTGDTITQESGVAPGVVTDATSRALYGDQPISLPSNRWVQTKSFGWGMAMAVAGDLAQPQPVFTALPIPGDPRLEFFDRVAVSDPDNTGAQLDVWYVGGTHGVDASGSYVQQLVARPARNRFLAGTGLVGIDLVG